jgi:ATP-binding cassette subfamily G (WHITE) protein 2 (PDR)
MSHLPVSPQPYKNILIVYSVLVRPSEIPRFWTFMYYVSPITYLVKGMFSAGVAHKMITCLAEEFVSIVPPAGQTCGQYLDLYMQAAGGQIANPYDAQLCKFYPLGSSNEYLSSLSIDYDTRWQNSGIVAGFIVVNVVGTFALYWLVRVPKPYR